MVGVDTTNHALNIMKTAYSYVRFSTPEQEIGDSERRQLALAESYCAKNGLSLSETVFADRGVSAFHGKHRENGALGRLLKHVQPGEVLLIEDCDRWSREDPLDALTRLREEVRRGIEVVFYGQGYALPKTISLIRRSCILTFSARCLVTLKTGREPNGLRPVGMLVKPLLHLGRPFA
jgi:DNA invertase Pin-like site-specific DNA recombinase